MNNSSSTLKKGLDAIFSPQLPTDTNEESRALGISNIPLHNITANPGQPRDNFDTEKLEELSKSIQNVGVIQPILVKKDKEQDKYILVAGERRWRASKINHLQTIPAIVIDESEENLQVLSLIENVQREDLNPIELSKSVCELTSKYNLTHEQIAQALGLSRSYVTNLGRLMKLDSDVQDMIISGSLNMGHARALLGITKEEQTALAIHVIQHEMSVRETEELIQRKLSRIDQAVTQESSYKTSIDNWVYKLKASLAEKVSVKMNEKGKGCITIRFSSEEEAEALVNRLAEK